MYNVHELENLLPQWTATFDQNKINTSQHTSLTVHCAGITVASFISNTIMYTLMVGEKLSLVNAVHYYFRIVVTAMQWQAAEWKGKWVGLWVGKKFNV